MTNAVNYRAFLAIREEKNRLRRRTKATAFHSLHIGSSGERRSSWNSHLERLISKPNHAANTKNVLSDQTLIIRSDIMLEGVSKARHVPRRLHYVDRFLAGAFFGATDVLST